MTHPLLQRLRTAPLLADSAMGTMLLMYGHPVDACLEELNLRHPEQVAAVHRANIAAGADLVETNTFGANRFHLETHGLADRVRDINFRGVKIAREEREISGRAVFVAGSIGPTGRTLAPLGQLAPADAQAAFAEQAGALLEAGVDLFLIETIADPAEMEVAIAGVREVSADIPIIATMTYTADGRTLSGETPAVMAGRLAAWGVTVVGANCSVGPQRLLGTIEETTRAFDELDLGDTPLPFVAGMPNAGFPSVVGGRLVYASTPEYFANFAREAVARGASLVGGCCGTRPEHIAAMRAALDAMHADGTDRTTTLPAPAPAVTYAAERAPDTKVREALTEQRFLRFVEIDPPKGMNPTKAIEGARMLADAGVDGINVADSPMARVRMSAMTLCHLIQQHVGTETILHYTTRDRSLMGLQSELLGAHAANIRNILALTGDPPSLGDYHGSTPVYDVDSVGLIRIITKLNEGEDSSGASVGQRANFTIACAVDPTRADLADEATRLKAKIEAGADFVMTQPIFDVAVWTRFLEVFGAERLPVPVMIGILPLQSTKHAEFLHNEVPGITLTDEARQRMREAGTHGRQEGIVMAQELLTQLRPMAEGVYLMPSFGRYEVAAEVISILD